MLKKYNITYLKDLDDFNEFKDLFENPVVNKIEIMHKVEVIRAMEVDLSLKHFYPKLTENKFLFNLIENVKTNHYYNIELRSFSVSSFLKFLIWLVRLEFNLTHQEREEFSIFLYEIHQNIINQYRVALSIVNLLRSYEEDRKKELPDNSRRNPLVQYLQLLEQVESVLNILISKYIKKATEKIIVSYSSKIMDNQYKINFILEKLKELNFIVPLKDFKEALELYQKDYSAPLALIRKAYEGIVKDLLKKFNMAPRSFRRNLAVLEDKLILHDTLTNHGSHHLEKDIAYDIYGLLSHYGSHPNLYNSQMRDFLIPATINLIYLILKRNDII